MSSLPTSLLLATTAHPFLLLLTLLTCALFLALTLVAARMANMEHDYDCEDGDPIFLTDEIRPLLDGGNQDPLKDYPQGRYVTRSVSKKRARRQEGKREVLRRLLEEDWAESSYGAVAGKRKMAMAMGDGGEGRAKRARGEERGAC